MHMSERMYQSIIGVLVLIILVGGAIMIGSRGAEESAVLNPDASTTAATGDEGLTSGASASTGAQATASAAQQTTPAQAATVTSGSDSITVQDQPASSTVTVAAVTISKRGWVAVRQGGHYLGAQFLRPGTYKDVVVTLLKPTEAGSAYEAVLFYDNGNTQFDWNADSVVTRADGSDVAAAFLAK